MSSDASIFLLVLASVVACFVLQHQRKDKLEDDDDGMDKYSEVALKWVIVVSIMGFIYWIFYK